MSSIRITGVIFTLFIAALPLSAGPQAGGMQMSTQSARARAFFEEGLAKMETLHTQAALQNWRKATEADPNFALAHIFLAYFAQDPTEQVAERGKAVAARHLAGPEEQLIIDWLAYGSKSQIVPAIQAMNEALERYQDDKHLAWLAGWWLMLAQDEPGRAIPMFERAIRLDPKFADPWNEVAYCYARTGNFDQAFEHIKRYTELLPHEANPQDSYAELSRMAGRYEDALDHYHASLKIDPTFIESQLGLGDTYALMGDEARARAEYAVALKKATNVQDVLWSLQSAATFVREGNLESADAAFKQVAKEARSYDFSNLEAEAYRSLALYQKDWANSVTYLEKAQTALRLSDKVPQALVDQEMAAVLRTSVDLALQNGNMEAAAVALTRLEKLANSNHDSVIQTSFHGASGAMLLAQGKYEDAISQLEEDTRNPFSMRGLTMAFEKTGAKEKAERMTARLATFNEPLIEQAVVVLPFRTSHTLAQLKHR
ncbi:MAG TPA: tetratricopeptide repeat protein [Candidatus Angelobacter sp.]